MWRGEIWSHESQSWWCLLPEDFQEDGCLCPGWLHSTVSGWTAYTYCSGLFCLMVCRGKYVSYILEIIAYLYCKIRNICWSLIFIFFYGWKNPMKIKSLMKIKNFYTLHLKKFYYRILCLWNRLLRYKILASQKLKHSTVQIIHCLIIRIKDKACKQNVKYI